MKTRTPEEELHHWRSQAGSLREQALRWKARWRTTSQSYTYLLEYAQPNIATVERFINQINEASAEIANLRAERDQARQERDEILRLLTELSAGR